MRKKLKSSKRLLLMFLLSTTTIFFGILFCLGVKDTTSVALTILQPSDRSRAELLGSLPHDRSCFTQGLEFVNNTRLLESCGLYGESRIRLLELDLENPVAPPKLIGSRDLRRDLFAEGLTVAENEIYLLTWRENTILVLDLETLQLKREIFYPKEGWGIAYNAKSKVFYATDGSQFIHHLRIDFDQVHFLKSVPVVYQGRYVKKLNEAEFDGTYLYLNSWYSSTIYRVDPETGVCVSAFDLQDIQDDEGDSFNGIASVKAPGFEDTFVVTGKLWRHMHHIRFFS